jgi:Zn ribbon nucleic-acid-binding protein
MFECLQCGPGLCRCERVTTKRMSADKSCEQCGGLGHLKCYIQNYENKTIGFTSVDCMYCKHEPNEIEKEISENLQDKVNYYRQKIENKE